MFVYRTGRFGELRLRQEGFECINQPSSRAPAPPQPEDGPIDVYDLLHPSQTPSERPRPRRPKCRTRLRLYCLRILIGLALLAAAIWLLPQKPIVVVSEISGTIAYLLGLTYGTWGRPRDE